MTNVAISALPAATTSDPTDLIPIVQSGTTKKLTNAQLFANPALAAGTVTKVAAAATDITNKSYVDSQIAGLNAQVPCDYGTTGTLTATYNNGTAGVGATLTASANGVLAMDGGAPTVGMRILVKDQTTTLQNGVYTVTNVGSASTAWVLTRATDYDATSEINAGDGFYINNGTVNKNTIWVEQTPAPVTVGTTAITFLQFSSTGLPKQPYAPNTAMYASSATQLTLGTLPVAAGGTGATTASTARTSLGAAASGANTDITSVALTTGTVSTTPAAAIDLANKSYVDTQIAGLNAQVPCAYGTTAALSATYVNGTAGVGATLTATANGVLTLDGGSPSVTMRILVKDQASNVQNGVYVVTSVGSASTPWVLTRATDYDQTSEINAGDGFYINNGTVNKNTIWVEQTPAPVNIGTSAIVFSQFGAGGATGLPKQPYTTNAALYANSTTSLTLGTLPVAGGGTGATTAGAARTSLGAAASGANTDITSVTLTSGTISATPAAATNITNKLYVDSLVNGLNAQIPCNYATTAPYTAVYNNNTTGVGATLTNTVNGVLTPDGVAAVAGQRILVKDQVNQFQNGAYVVTDPGSAATKFVLTRGTDYDQTAEINAGDGFYITSGATLANTIWVEQTAAPIAVGTTPITFSQFGGGSGGSAIKQPYANNGAVYANSTSTLTTGTLPITGGGTGATTASAALNNLGGVSTGKAIAMAIVFGG